MNTLIASVLRGRVNRTGIFDVLGGLATTQLVMFGEKQAAIPVCIETKQQLVPDTKKGTLGFFCDTNGCQLTNISGEKAGRWSYAFAMKFLCWYNVDESGNNELGTVDHILIPRIIREVIDNSDQSEKEQFNQRGYSNLIVSKVSSLPKTPAIFSDYSFYAEGLQSGMFARPYDYFGLSIQGSFDIGVKGQCFDDSALPKFFQKCK